MKETIEVVKCDLCGKVIDTDSIPENEYHYRYQMNIVKDDQITVECKENDICPECSRKICVNYNNAHIEYFNTYIDMHIEDVISELYCNRCKYRTNNDDDYEITLTSSQLRDTMRSVLCRTL